MQDLVDELVARRLAPSSVRNAILPLRAIFRRAHQRDEVAVNPTLKLALPASRTRRERVARPEEAAALLAALPAADRAVWATALYAGLRLGELRGLRWCDVDIDAGIIRVRQAWDRVTGPITPKSRASVRNVPLAENLRLHLLEQRLRQGLGGAGLVFSADGERPFDPTTLRERANKVWRKAKLASIGLHECRHTYAAFMIAAGLNAKALSTYMGHSSITVTLDRYGHLLPGNEAQAAGLLDRYLDAATEATT